MWTKKYCTQLESNAFFPCVSSLPHPHVAANCMLFLGDAACMKSIMRVLAGKECITFDDICGHDMLEDLFGFVLTVFIRA